MDGRRDNVVKFRQRPKTPPPPRHKPPGRKSPGGGEPAINWSRAPKFVVFLVLLLLLMFLVGRLGDWISGLGA